MLFRSGIKIKIAAKFLASRRLRLEDIKRIMSPETRPKVSELSRNRPLAPVVQILHSHPADKTLFDGEALAKPIVLSFEQ